MGGEGGLFFACVGVREVDNVVDLLSWEALLVGLLDGMANDAPLEGRVEGGPMSEVEMPSVICLLCKGRDEVLRQCLSKVIDIFADLCRHTRQLRAQVGIVCLFE
jgi:hypothetical protein